MKSLYIAQNIAIKNAGVKFNCQRAFARITALRLVIYNDASHVADSPCGVLIQIFQDALKYAFYIILVIINCGWFRIAYNI